MRISAPSCSRVAAVPLSCCPECVIVRSRVLTRFFWGMGIRDAFEIFDAMRLMRLMLTRAARFLMSN